MSNPYSSQSASGYNSNPPSDDGSEVASNQVYWATIKTKLADPIKTLADSINSAVSSAFGLIFGQTINSQSGNYTIDSDDQGAFVEFTGVATASLPAAATAGGGFAVCILNNSSALVTIDANSSETINGETSIYLGPGESAVLTTDGSEWMAAISRLFPNRHQTKSGNYTIAVTDIGSLIECTAALTLSLPAAATAGLNFRVAVVNSGIGNVTIDPSSSETIQNDTTLVLPPGASAIIHCDASEWFALVTGSEEECKSKVDDEPVNNSTTLQSDDDLAGYTIKAGKRYRISGFFYITTSAVADFKAALAFSETPQKFAVGFGSGGNTTTPGGAVTYALSQTEIFSFITGFVEGHASNDGTMELQWAQGTLEVQDTILKEGSWISIKEMA